MTTTNSYICAQIEKSKSNILIMIKVEGHSNLRRDQKSNSIVNVDMEAFKAYQMQVNKLKSRKKLINLKKNWIRLQIF